MTCAMNIELGAYVLHALEQDEADAVTRHLGQCALCQAELRELEFTASLLSLLSAEDLEQFEQGLSGPGTDADDVPPRTRRRGRGHRAPLLLVAAVLAAATAFVPRTLVHHDAPPPASVVRAADPATHVRAAVSVRAQQGGTRLHLSLVGAYPKGWCALVAHSRDGRSDTAATWRADAGGTADVTGTTAIPADRLRELDVVTDTGAVLVTIPMPGPDS
jgi:anti-sigma factor RsiW